MKRLVKFPLEDGGFICVEVEIEDDEADVIEVSRGLHQASKTLESALETVKPTASAIIQKFRFISDPPDEIEVEFGLKLNAEVGALITNAGAEAHYTVKLTWKRNSKTE